MALIKTYILAAVCVTAFLACAARAAAGPPDSSHRASAIDTSRPGLQSFEEVASRSFGGLLAQARKHRGGRGDQPPWLLYGGIGVLVVVVVVIAVLVLRGGGEDRPKKSKRKGGVAVTENQVDGYRLLNLMMTGQTSQVWEVSELSSGRHFALKMLLPENVHKGPHRNFLFHEAEVGRQVTHPKVIKMLAAIKDWDHPYLIMEFFPSTNLKLRLMHKDPFVKEHLRGIIEQTATALAFMHEKGWVHRDVKPDNILVNASAEVRLIDFALAKRLSKKKPGRFTRRTQAQGTRSYMSPEQIRGEPLDARADLYSFGATIYELMTGRPPFRGRSPGDLLSKQVNEKAETPITYNSEITREMADLVLAMLNKDREARPRDFLDFLMKFRGIRIFKIAPAVKKKEPGSDGAGQTTKDTKNTKK